MVPVLLSLSVRRHSHAQLAAIHLISSHSWLSRFFRLPHHPCPLRPRSTIRAPSPTPGTRRCPASPARFRPLRLPQSRLRHLVHLSPRRILRLRKLFHLRSSAATRH